MPVGLEEQVSSFGPSGSATTARFDRRLDDSASGALLDDVRACACASRFDLMLESDQEAVVAAAARPGKIRKDVEEIVGAQPPHRRSLARFAVSGGRRPPRAVPARVRPGEWPCQP